MPVYVCVYRMTLTLGRRRMACRRRCLWAELRIPISSRSWSSTTLLPWGNHKREPDQHLTMCVSHHSSHLQYVLEGSWISQIKTGLPFDILLMQDSPLRPKSHLQGCAEIQEVNTQCHRDDTNQTQGDRKHSGSWWRLNFTCNSCNVHITYTTHTQN